MSKGPAWWLTNHVSCRLSYPQNANLIPAKRTSVLYVRMHTIININIFTAQQKVLSVPPMNVWLQLEPFHVRTADTLHLIVQTVDFTLIRSGLELQIRFHWNGFDGCIRTKPENSSNPCNSPAKNSSLSAFFFFFSFFTFCATRPSWFPAQLSHELHPHLSKDFRILAADLCRISFSSSNFSPYFSNPLFCWRVTARMFPFLVQSHRIFRPTLSAL